MCVFCVYIFFKEITNIFSRYSARMDCGGLYSLNVQLLAADHTVIDKFGFGIDIPVRCIWKEVSFHLSDFHISKYAAECFIA